MQTDIIKSPLARQLAREALEAAETAAQRWIDFLDLVRGDPDLEDSDEDLGADDVGENRTTVEVIDQRKHRGHALAYAHCDDDAEDDDPREEDDPGGCEHDGREPDHDTEVETWAHPDDHPAELFIGRPPANANNPVESA